MNNPIKKLKSFLPAAVRYALLFLAAGLVLFYHLGDRMLWGDEAETAVLAKNILQFGIPRTFDGVNHITLFGESVDGNEEDVWTWSPWLDEYVAAASFALFGETTWAARFLFALVAWLSVIGLARMVYAIFASHLLALLAAFLLASSELFLLHGRQCRYYALIVAAQIVLMYGLYLLFRNDRKSVWLVALALLVQFYSNYIVVAANLPVLGLTALFHARKYSGLGRNIFTAGALFALLAAPWLLYAKPWLQTQAIAGDDWLQKLLYYSVEIHFHIMPLFFFVLPLLWFCLQRSRPLPQDVAPRSRKKKSGAEFTRDTARVSAVTDWENALLLFFPSFLLVVVVTPGAYLRYILPLIPVSAILMALWLVRLLHNRLLLAAAVLVLTMTNWLAVAGAFFLSHRHPARLTLPSVVHSVMHTYEDRFESALTFLQQNTQPGQSVYVFDPEFPLHFYTKLKIVDGRFYGNHLPEPLPDWILAQSLSGVIELPPLSLDAELASLYERIDLHLRDSRRGGTIPEPDIYEYLTAPGLKPLTIYKKLGVGPQPNQ